MIKETKQWYKSWFDTPFYHILYKERDDKEAKAFMEKLTTYLNIPENGKILDLACGKGRHSIHLNNLGYDVTGLDLSTQSIAYAKQFKNEHLRFDVHDMSKPYHSKFDAVFNLFTSFGYFEHEEDNQNTINSIKSNLIENGFGIIDFLNAQFILDNLVPDEIKTVGDITFTLKRFVEDGYIVKDISFVYNDNNHNYQERVKAFTLEDFKIMFKKANIHLLETFGDYKLSKFNSKYSERLIMIFM